MTGQLLGWESHKPPDAGVVLACNPDLVKIETKPHFRPMSRERTRSGCYGRDSACRRLRMSIRDGFPLSRCMPD